MLLVKYFLVYDMICKSLIIHFNYISKTINFLIHEFQKNNLDEDSLVILSKYVGRFLGFFHKIFLRELFKFSDYVGDMKFNLNDDMTSVNELIEGLLNNIDFLIKDVVAQKLSYKKQSDVDAIIVSLTLLSNLLDNLKNLVLSVLRYQSGNIDESTFRDDYREFKLALEKDKMRFDSIMNS